MVSVYVIDTRKTQTSVFAVHCIYNVYCSVLYVADSLSFVVDCICCYSREMQQFHVSEWWHVHQYRSSLVQMLLSTWLSRFQMSGRHLYDDHFLLCLVLICGAPTFVCVGLGQKLAVFLLYTVSQKRAQL